MFSRDVGLTDAQQALEIMLTAEQLQVPECAEICQHYMQSCPMSWPVALALLQLQHQHLQEQRQQDQQKAQQDQARLSRTSTPGTNQHKAASKSLAAPDAFALGSISSFEAAVAAITPALPVPKESTYLQQLLGEAQNFVLQHFEDLEAIMSSREGREQLLMLPYDALRAILEHPHLRVASENTALLAAAAWLAANAGEADVAHSSTAGVAEPPAGAAEPPAASQEYGAAPAPDVFPAEESPDLLPAEVDTAPLVASLTPEPGAVEAAAASTAAAAALYRSVEELDHHHQQQELLGGGGDGIHLLQDLCDVLRLHQLSFTYLMHVLPRQVATG
eukprot:gene7915-8111_t